MKDTLDIMEDLISEEMPKSYDCPNCEAMMINGVYCHAIGCPSYYLFIVQECKWCGEEYRQSEESEPRD